jgi:sterol desaturase/sphingolipid hydroxylase (fatty acid hydroxylase superfamily)
MNRRESSAANSSDIPAGQATKPAPATQLSRSAFFADFYFYPTAAVVFIVIALVSDLHQWQATILAVVTGFCFWTFVEYLLHRYVLHHVKWVKVQHDVHHNDQKALVGTPTWFSFLVFLALVTMPAVLFSSIELAAGFTAGMMLGYLWYVTAHYGIHHWHVRSSGYMSRLRRRHALHHHFDELGNFGVTSGFWDYVFRTNITAHRE